MHAIAKILARHAGLSEVVPGQVIQAEPDYVMMHDRGIIRSMQRFREMDGARVWDPAKCIVVFDHFYPAPRVQDADAHRRARAFVEEQEIANFHPSQGIAHLLLNERGYAFPGALIVGTDSHTITDSAMGCMAMGIGHSDTASLLAIGRLWLKVPEVVRFDIHGKLRPGVTPKDVMLRILQLHGQDACVYQGVEYAGPTVREMSMDGRFTLCNMAVEVGGKTGYVAPDEVTWKWMEGRRDRAACNPQTTDSDSDYAAIIDVDVSALEPLVAIPHDLSEIVPAGELGDTRIDEAVLGTCTNGRLDDFRAAAQLLKGRHIAGHVRLVVNPGSNETYKQAMKEGLIDILIDAGATVGMAGCGPCAGCHLGMLGSGEVAISSSSRNFRGRMGPHDSGIYIASPATVVASAVAGHIVDPNTLA
jgi:3-isopropylmalate/(R)-2-methylmalate dehydratase large subunit